MAIHRNAVPEKGRFSGQGIGEIARFRRYPCIQFFPVTQSTPSTGRRQKIAKHPQWTNVRRGGQTAFHQTRQKPNFLRVFKSWCILCCGRLCFAVFGSKKVKILYNLAKKYKVGRAFFGKIYKKLKNS